jgi:hypothetical protein
MANPEQAMDEAKVVARHLIEKIDASQVDLIDPLFDSAAGDEFRPPKADTAHGFALGGAEVLVATIIYVVGNLFLDAIKDATKDQIKEMLKDWVSGKSKLQPDERLKLLEGLDRTAKALKLPAESRIRLRSSVEKVL